MRIAIVCLALFTLPAASACTSVECDRGTIERSGKCEPADVTTDPGTCGPGTKLEGNVCVSTIQCDPATTMPVIDPMTGETKCEPFSNDCTACPPPGDASKQTICGQIYDFESNQPFMATGATGARCPATPSASGPCALAITAFDALQFVTSPSTAQPLAVDDVCIDDQGHYAVRGVAVPAGPLIALGIDDAVGNVGPTGVTNAVAITVAKMPALAVASTEHWIVKPATTDMWMTTGGPPVSSGVFAAVFRAHACPGGTCTGDPLAPQSDVAIVKPVGNAYYFAPGQAARMTIDPTQMMTGANGTGILTGITAMDGPVTGMGGIVDTADCSWESTAAAALPNIVAIQVFRKIGAACNE
jgi:hypothetical protein